MNISRLKYFVSLSMVMLISLTSLHAASTGSIVGHVRDEVSGDPLPGANVVLAGTALGAATNLNGEFTISRVPPGTYDLRVTYIGYEPMEITVRVTSDEKVTQPINMKFKIIEGAEVTISAQREGQLAAINRQLTANSVMNVVSAERIQELPDQNVAESISRLPGISVTRNAGEASKVVIRGLEPKLSAIMVNGVRIPSTDDEDRSVDLSMISSDLLEAIEVYKSPTPDMDGEAIGGVVNLKIKKAPNHPVTRLKLDGGYNQLNSDYGNYKAVAEYSRRFFGQSLGIIAGFNIDKNNRGSEQFTGRYRAEQILGEEGIKILPTSYIIENIEQERKKWGGNLTLDYRLDQGRIWLTNFYTHRFSDPFSIQKRYDAGNGEMRYDLRSRETTIKGLSSSFNGELNVFGSNVDWGASRFRTETDNYFDATARLIEGNAFDTAILDLEDTDTYAPAARNVLDKIYLRETSSRPNSTDQTDWTLQANIETPINFGKSIAGFLKFGAKYSAVERGHASDEYFWPGYYNHEGIEDAIANHPRELIFDENGRISALNFIGSDTKSMDIVNGDYNLFPIFNESSVKEWEKYHRNYYQLDYEQFADAYDLEETITAGYAMAKLNFGQVLTIIPGVRYEYSDNIYNAKWSNVRARSGTGILIDTTSTRKYDHWLPHLHMKVSPLSWFNVRLSAVKTLARPDYFWISPWTWRRDENASIRRGNPDLIETKAWNYDLAMSFYDNFFGLLTIGGFYKDMEDIFYEKQSLLYNRELIEELQIPNGSVGWDMDSYENSDEARVWGFEIDLQTNGEFVPGLPSFLKGLVLQANYARIWSETYFPTYTLETDFDFTTSPPTVLTTYTEFERKGQMPGQANHILNVALGYDVGSLSARISVLYQDAGLDELTNHPLNDTYNDDFFRWDTSVKYRLTDSIALRFNLVNITGQPDSAFRGESSNPTSRDYFDMTGSAGIDFVLK